MFVYQAPYVKTAPMFCEVSAHLDRSSFSVLKSNHALSLLFSIFALGTLYDTTHTAYSIEAKEYYALARVAFEFVSSPEKTSITSVQAMVCILLYSTRIFRK